MVDVDEEALLQLMHRWRDKAINAGREINRMVLAFEAGRDGFWLTRWLRARNIEAYVIHPNSVAVSREHRRAKTDRLARADNARVRRGIIQLAWRFLMFQEESTLVEWYRSVTNEVRGARKIMIVALAGKLLIAGEVSQGVAFHTA